MTNSVTNGAKFCKNLKKDKFVSELQNEIKRIGLILCSFEFDCVPCRGRLKDLPVSIKLDSNSI